MAPRSVLIHESSPARSQANTHCYPSHDRSRFAVVEYDEGENGSQNPPPPSLKNPPAQAVIVDVASRSQFSVDAPLTAYGHAQGPDGKLWLMGSYQLGQLHLIDLSAKSVVKTVKIPKLIRGFLFTKDQKHVLVIASTWLSVLQWPTLRKLSVRRWDQLLPKEVASAFYNMDVIPLPDGEHFRIAEHVLRIK